MTVAERLIVLQTEIRQCTRCRDAGFITEARPLTEGTGPAPFLVIGQAPSRTDHETGTFYRGPAGRKFRAWLKEAGFTDEEFGTRLYLAAITKCFPGRVTGSSKDRLPSRTERNLCRPWLEQEIGLVNPEVVLLFGGLAIRTFLSSAPLEELVGRTFEREDRLLIPLPHSSGASTWLNSERNRALLTEAIEQIRAARTERSADRAALSSAI
ncbi:MAG: uracil-DNA glycosylase family protein [Capsulimonadales bacterium]|nr:uracil-DNA glycosylase family protein [Capsulimonadales bacterium]